MTTLYKLTDAHDRTYGGCQWGEGVEVVTSGKGNLCGPGFTHWYTDPLLAVLLNPIHAKLDLSTAHLWKGEGEVAEPAHGLKVGCTRARTLRRVELPRVTRAARVRFGILCSLEVYTEPNYRKWADGWLSGKDRSKQAVVAAVRAVGVTVDATVVAADAVRATWVAQAVWDAAWAAREAAWAARTAVVAAMGAAYAAGAVAEDAAQAAGLAAGAAGVAPKPLDLLALAERAVREEEALAERGEE